MIAAFDQMVKSKSLGKNEFLDQNADILKEILSEESDVGQLGLPIASISAKKGTN
jgi:hypothetical protein